MFDKNFEDLIYLDNSATSWPKPPGVAEAMVDFMAEVGANPGRAGHRKAIQSSRIVYETRENICTLLNADDPLRVVFSKNVTEAINVALYGLIKPGDHVVTSSMEHNAVMRPLRDLERRGVDLSLVQCTPEGLLDPLDIARSIRKHTRLVVINHSSNVTGTILPIGEIGAITREHDLLFLVDTAQSAGRVPIDMLEDHIDLLAFTGHKSLLGPMGTGGLIIGERVDQKKFTPLILGGTGSRSEEELQPAFLPDSLESGTLNMPGIAGLNAAIRWLLQKGVEQIQWHEQSLTKRLIDGLSDLPGVHLYSCCDHTLNSGTISFNIAGQASSEVGLRLDEEFGVLTRVGLHCSPAAHKTMGTFPRGTVRLGMGIFNTIEQIDYVLQAIIDIVGGG